MTDWKSILRADPTEWLLLNACPSIQYRVLTDVHNLSSSEPSVAKVRKSAYESTPIKQLLRLLRKDGTWGGRISAADPRKSERSSEHCLWTLFEGGLSRDFKEIRAAAKPLKALLAVSKEPDLREFKKLAKDDPARQRFLRWRLRAVALKLLARAGYRDDQKVAHGIVDLLERTVAYVAQPGSRNPVESVGTALPVVRRGVMRDGYVFFPDVTNLCVFGSTPELLSSTLQKTRLKRVFDHVLSEGYQRLCPDLGAVRTARGTFARGGGVELHETETYLKEGRLEELLFLIEQFARLGLINRYPLLMAHMEWLLSQQEKDGRWNLPVKYFGARPGYMRYLRIERDWKSPTRKIADQTFRMLLIVRFQWERQIRMLDRGEELFRI
jgi:hypothetical protein